MSLQVDWKAPGPVASAFMNSDAFVRGIRGPIGSGKSVTCCIEIFRRGIEQEPNKRKIRRTRWAVIRNTAPMLKSTTIKTWRDWFDDEWGKFTWAPPMTHMMKFAHPSGDGTSVEIEVIFLALDRDDDINKLLSLELTGVWINEAREISKEIVDNASSRVGRFPSIRDGGPTWYGTIMDTNSPDEQHWWGIMSGEVEPPDWLSSDDRKAFVKPADWEFFSQPPGLIEIKDPDNENLVLGYEPNNSAENIAHLPRDYYIRNTSGKTVRWITVYLLNRFATVKQGKPVYPTFKESFHVARERLPVMQDGVQTIVGIDFGRTPAAVLLQVVEGGSRWHVVSELIRENVSAQRFAPMILHWLAELGVDPKSVMFSGDPAGDHLSEAEDTSPIRVMRAAGVPVQAAWTNDINLRTNAVEMKLNQVHDGGAAFLVSPNCTMLRQGFDGAYQWDQTKTSLEEQIKDMPKKNRWSHVHDALQYSAVAAGGARAVSQAGAAPVVTAQRRQSSAFTHMSRARGGAKRGGRFGGSRG